ncbi:sugar ABC transporter ATP-binding protein [Pseudonocardia asaccharolytica]|uniref:Sugar ABC transporter ATP-binding protein n=1 Tax=Pseudonocardia asaccharolytica DSM 44247 = NBRC 16224 TaxID=1123024 RepID=A0A511D633_9PSEU|nr:sugar ABC transporter ATP-binding protein [Pseudonocardia asaccharolytica]GEL20117.1 sugar ABC transporter ATP-binding protein [Pseudonocardia asaccharolytica DSM 44247 = NBRC 16224]
MDTVLQVRSISKSFGPNRVLRGVSFRVEKGTIYGLMGANGAGKSTLIKILSGAHVPDGGEILLGGRAVTFPDPIAAQRLGVATVYQNPDDGVILDMTVAENLALDRLTDSSSPPGFSRRRTERHALEVAQTLGMHLTRQVLRSPVRQLGVSERQLLVLARALSRKPEILILDEPTSALSAEETVRLFDLVRSLVDDGMTALFVTHKLAEFDRLCRRVGVLRDGAMQGEFVSDERHGDDRHGFDWPAALTALFDRTPAEMQRTELPGGPTVLELSDVQVFADSAPFGLELREGQVTVLLGLLGSGKTELLEWVFGARSIAGGRRVLDGRAFDPRHPGDAVKRGVYLLPESRHEQAIIPGWPVFAQMTLPFVRRFSVGTLMRRSAERRAAGSMMTDIGIVARGPSSPIQTLSGGNQQKVVIGRWLLGAARVLLLDEPFRGVDINARHDIGATVRELTTSAAVLVATSDLDEALEVADRIVMFNHGRIVADLPRSAASRGRIIDAMSARPSTLLDRERAAAAADPANA